MGRNLAQSPCTQGFELLFRSRNVETLCIGVSTIEFNLNFSKRTVSQWNEIILIVLPLNICFWIPNKHLWNQAALPLWNLFVANIARVQTPRARFRGGVVMTRGIRKSQVRQCYGFCTADFWSSLAYESAEQNSKNCLTPGFLIPLVKTLQLS